MEVAIVLPPELLALAAAPPSGGAQDPLRSAAEDAGADGSAPGFAQLLELIAALPGGGESLPQAGKELPTAATFEASEASADLPATAVALPQPVFLTLTQPLAVVPAAMSERASAVGGRGVPTSTGVTALITTQSVVLPDAELFDVAIGREPGERGTALEGQIASGSELARRAAPAPASTVPALPLAQTAPEAPAAPLPTSLSSILPSVDAKPVARARAPLLMSDALDSADAVAEQFPDTMKPTRRSTAALFPLLAPSATQLSTQPQVAVEVAASTPATLAPDLAPAPSPHVTSSAGRGLGPTQLASMGAPPDALGAALGHSASQPLDTAAPRWHDALAGRIHWLIDHDVGEARIRLSPPELGALDVKVSVIDDKTYVQLAASSSLARDELTQSLPRLRDLLSSSGLDLAGATVSDGRHERSAYGAGTEPATMAPEILAPASEPQMPSRYERRASGRIDLFA
jgi:flagellar hook-length control protein FliK